MVRLIAILRFMETPDVEPVPAKAKTEKHASPTAQDFENERIRREIAERMEAQWVECATWALKAFGPGWEPRCRHFLLDKNDEERCRRTGEKPVPAATVYTVRNEAGEKRHFTVTEDGEAVECESMEAGFGEKLLAPHPTRQIEVRGQMVAPHWFSLCFAPYELYRPMSAEGLAKLRATRERKREEKKDRQFAELNPLFASAGITRKDLE